MNTEEQAKKMQQIVAKAWSDEGFKQQLLANPRATLQGAGIELPPGVELKVVENTSSVRYFVLPMKLSCDELSDDDLDRVSGGALTPAQSARQVAGLTSVTLAGLSGDQLD